MDKSVLHTGDKVVIKRNDFAQLFAALQTRNYRLIGPTVRNDVVIYDEIATVADLPVGWADKQDNGKYSLEKREDNTLFGYTPGAHSWKPFLHPPEIRLWQAGRVGNGFVSLTIKEDIPRYAFIGVRSCELHAIQIQDRVFLGGPSIDQTYKARRERLFILAVNCSQAADTCFCLSLQTGPQLTSGYDLGMTEILQGAQHYFVVDIGSEKGAELLADVAYTRAQKEENVLADDIVARTSQQIKRYIDTKGIKELLYSNYEHPHWDDVAERCLSCTNCTMVCPTCFCTSVEDVTELSGQKTVRLSRWDSCFSLNFSYIHGGNIRSSVRSRYRQWLTHKFATWLDQFGTSGCVGCGRCITWCPAGIDITAELRALRKSAELTADLSPGE